MSLSETIFFFIPFSTTSDVLSLMTVCKDFKEVTRKSIEFFTAIEYQDQTVMCGRTFLNTCYCDACGFDSNFFEQRTPRNKVIRCDASCIIKIHHLDVPL